VTALWYLVISKIFSDNHTENIIPVQLGSFAQRAKLEGWIGRRDGWGKINPLNLDLTSVKKSERGDYIFDCAQ
jgi:hypothetical protein